MALEDAIDRVGRVEYVEPNNLFVHSPGDVIQNGIPQPYENYSFSVNLRIMSGNRYDCGMPGNGEDIANNILEYSSENGTLSFIDGTTDNGQSYLTTNFTDISMNNPETNTKECLGITSINIKYNSYFLPTVDITFVDIMGASLMLPAEYEYYNNGGASKGVNNTSESASKFFKAFFGFPYPLFKLSVKGFYGKETTYDLALQTCHIKFNSDIGCFEISANFVGYMYGFYTDFPFSLAFVAPYIDLYGKNTWEEKKNRGDFVYLTTSDTDKADAMYTFPELKVKVNDIEKKFDKEIEETVNGKKREEAKHLAELLRREVIPNYPPKIEEVQGAEWYPWSKTETDDNMKGYFMLSVDNLVDANKVIFKSFLKFGKALNEYNNYVQNTSKYFKSSGILVMSPFGEIFNDAKSRVGATTDEEALDITKYDADAIKDILSRYIAVLKFSKDATDPAAPKLKYESSSSQFGTQTEEEYTDLITEIRRLFDEDVSDSPLSPHTRETEWTVLAFKIDDIKYRQKIVATLNNLSSELNKLQEELKKERDKTIEETLGFNPTLRNFFNMTFAHVDTFMSIFYNTLERIHQSIIGNDSTRLKNSLCGKNIFVDVNENTLKSNASNGGKLPPFTLFYREATEKGNDGKKMVLVWPGRLPGGKNLDEVKLVEAILNASQLDKKNYPTVTPKDNTAPTNGAAIPTNYYDIVRAGGNPYLDVIDEKSVNDANIMDEILRVFVLRCFYSLLTSDAIKQDAATESGKEAKSEASKLAERAKLIGKLEAENVARAFDAIGMAPTENFIQKLLGLPKDGSGMVGGYTKGERPMFTNADETSITYSFITKNDTPGERYYPVGTFLSSLLNMCSRIGDVGMYSRNFFTIDNENGTLNSEDSFRVYGNDKVVERVLSYNTEALKLFKNYSKLPETISGVKYSSELDSKFPVDSSIAAGTVKTVSAMRLSSKFLPTLPSYRVTEAGVTSIFMDPLYYAQKNILSRAYLFLFGIPYGEKKDFFLPEKIENGDYPALMLLREGAAYWRVSQADQITYSYDCNGTVKDTLPDIEAHDRCLGRAILKNGLPKNASKSRKEVLKGYFIKWATGNKYYAGETEQEFTPDYEKITYPDAPIYFPEIEAKLALYDFKDSTVLGATISTPTFLGEFPDGPYRAISRPLIVGTETTPGFANFINLSKIYEVGNDYRLGTLNGDIRQGVKIRTTLLSDDESAGPKTPEDIKSFAKSFSSLFRFFNTVIDYALVERDNPSMTVTKDAMIQGFTSFMDTIREKNSVSIEDYKKRYGGSANGEPPDDYAEPELYDDDDFKLALYITLKNLYDKWTCSRRRESWIFSAKPGGMYNNGIHSDFERFYFIDGFYHDIGMTKRPNTKNTIEQLNAIGGFTHNSDEFNLVSKNLMNALGGIANQAQCAMIPLPTMLGLAKKPNEKNRHTIEDVFRAFPYNDMVRSNDIESSFVVFEPGKMSSHLGMDDPTGVDAYKDDGFDIANTWGKIVPMSSLSDSTEDGYVVPAFGVTFAKQNQSFFKSISLSTEDHQTTMYVIRTTQMLATNSNTSPREVSLAGQDMYAAFSNYSYMCTVKMLGDSQITPLMFFQLNNVPLWKGAYMITQVSHSISVDGMETEFKGARLCRYAPPAKNDKVTTPATDAEGITPQSAEEVTVVSSDSVDMFAPTKPLDKIEVQKVRNIIFQLDRTTYSDTFDVIYGKLSALVYYSPDSDVEPKEEVIAIGSTLEPARGPLKKIEDLTPVDRENVFTLPEGRYSFIMLESAGRDEEYRDPDDTFYAFTNKQHIAISDIRLGVRRSEIVTGETNMSIVTNDCYRTEAAAKKISIGGFAPVMLGRDVPLADGKGVDIDRDQTRAKYRELFDLIKRMNDANKPMSFFIKRDEKNFKPPTGS